MDLDSELADELLDAFVDLYDETESCLSNLKHGTDAEELNRLFRAIHNIKGNAGLCQITAIVDFTHAIEEVAESLRSQRFDASEPVCESILLGMDRLRDIHHRELRGKHYDNLREPETIALFSELAKADSKTVAASASAILSFMGAGAIIDPPEKIVGNNVQELDVCSLLADVQDTQRKKDLIFFKEIAEKIDGLNQHWHGRSAVLFDWAQKINMIGGNIVDREQLAAAVYLHDLGMSFIPGTIFSKKGKLELEEIILIRKHTLWGYEFLMRMSGWEDAALMVLHHHEHVDGEGFPYSLKHGEIHPGARLFTIIDVFYSLTHGRADRRQTRTILRALSAINARIDSHFDGMWVQCFNHMIRTEIKAGRLKSTK